jgi:polyisoprenoid-binding protein YceI
VYRIKILSAACLLLALATACQVRPVAPSDDTALTRPATVDVLAWPEGDVYEVRPELSELRIVVYPDGPLARFGHAHVIGGKAIRGRVVLAEVFEDSALKLEIDTRLLDVDRPAWRAAEGLDAEMEPAAIAGTQRNMRSPALLDVERYPTILIESIGISGPRWQPDIEARITLRGQARELLVPVTLDLDDQRLIATGRIVLRQSEFGIEPFSAAGGSLRVADEILIRFRIVAEAD